MSSARCGHFMFFVVQAATALILYHRRQHQLQRVPVPDQLRRRGLVPAPVARPSAAIAWSSPTGSSSLTISAVVLLVFVGSTSTRSSRSTRSACSPPSPWPGSAWPSTTTAQQGAGLAAPAVINFSAGVLTTIVVVIFAIVKFTEGAWLIVIIFPLLVYVLIQLNRRYRMEAEVLENIGGRKAPDPPNYTRRTVLVLVDEFNLATIAALRYARGLRPTGLRAVHFVIDTDRAKELREAWLRADRGIPLDLVDCPDRRLPRAAGELVAAEAARAGHARDRRAAQAQLSGAARPATARPDRRQDRPGGEPDTALRRHHHPVRRGGPPGGAARAADRPGGPAGQAGGEDRPSTSSPRCARVSPRSRR